MSVHKILDTANKLAVVHSAHQLNLERLANENDYYAEPALQVLRNQVRFGSSEITRMKREIVSMVENLK